MFKNRLKDLKAAIFTTDQFLRAAREAENEYPLIEINIDEALTAIASAAMALSALEDFTPFLEALTSAPPHSLNAP